MRRRDRRDDEVVDVNEEPQATRTAPPVANVLALQQAAGNHAVANLLRPRTPQLMRDPVGGTATWAKQRHHPDYEFDFGGDNKVRPHFDKWYSEPLKDAGPLTHAQTLTPNAVQQILAGYNGDGSIVDAIVNALVATDNTQFPDTMGQPDTGRLGGPYTQAGKYNVQSALVGSDSGREFAAHYLMLQHNLRVRVGDMGNNVITDAVVESKSAGKKQPDQKLKLNWGDALAAARLDLHAQLLANEPAPGLHGVELAHSAVANVGGALGQLREWGLIGEDGKRQSGANKVGAKDGKAATTYKLGKLTPAKTPGNKAMSFNFGINHIRSILYIEWRAFDELKKLAQAPQQNPQQVAQVVQQLIAVGDGGGGD